MAGMVLLLNILLIGHYSCSLHKKCSPSKILKPLLLSVILFSSDEVGAGTQKFPFYKFYNLNTHFKEIMYCIVVVVA